MVTTPDDPLPHTRATWATMGCKLRSLNPTGALRASACLGLNIGQRLYGQAEDSARADNVLRTYGAYTLGDSASHTASPPSLLATRPRRIVDTGLDVDRGPQILDGVPYPMLGVASHNLSSASSLILCSSLQSVSKSRLLNICLYHTPYHHLIARRTPTSLVSHRRSLLNSPPRLCRSLRPGRPSLIFARCQLCPERGLHVSPIGHSCSQPAATGVCLVSHMNTFPLSLSTRR